MVKNKFYKIHVWGWGWVVVWGWLSFGVGWLLLL